MQDAGEFLPSNHCRERKDISVFYFAEWKTTDGLQHCKRLDGPESLFAWLQAFHDQFGCLPKGLTIFKGSCVLDIA